MTRESDTEKPSVVYTGIVCRRCAAPVARSIGESTMECPACGHSWDAGTPIVVRAA
jgi:DNA-directed RNA polymerase subunit RPC12/RpoP